MTAAERGRADALVISCWRGRWDGRAGRVMSFPRPALLPLFRSLDVPVAIADGDDIPPADLQAPLMSLPHLVGPAAPFWPTTGPWLTPEPARLARWRDEFPRSGGPTIAIAWQGNADYRGDWRRPVPVPPENQSEKSPG